MEKPRPASGKVPPPGAPAPTGKKKIILVKKKKVKEADASAPAERPVADEPAPAASEDAAFVPETAAAAAEPPPNDPAPPTRKASNVSVKPPPRPAETKPVTGDSKGGKAANGAAAATGPSDNREGKPAAAAKPRKPTPAEDAAAARAAAETAAAEAKAADAAKRAADKAEREARIWGGGAMGDPTADDDSAVPAAAAEAAAVATGDLAFFFSGHGPGRAGAAGFDASSFLAAVLRPHLPLDASTSPDAPSPLATLSLPSLREALLDAPAGPGGPLPTGASRPAPALAFREATAALGALEAARVQCAAAAAAADKRVAAKSAELARVTTAHAARLADVRLTAAETLEAFGELEGRIGRVAATTARVGDRLAAADAQRARADEAATMVGHLQAFDDPESVALPKLFTRAGREAQAAAAAQRLLLLAEELSQGGPVGPPTPGGGAPMAPLSRAAASLQRYVDALENRLLAAFDGAAADRDLESMAAHAATLAEFSGGASAVNYYVASRPMFLSVDEVDDEMPVLMRSYDLTVATSDIPGAGTTSRVLITLHGDAGSTDATELDSVNVAGESPHDILFARGQRDAFTLAAAVGTLQRVTLSIDGKDGWHCAEVVVSADGVPPVAFPCGKWLDDKKDGGMTTRTLAPPAGAMGAAGAASAAASAAAPGAIGDLCESLLATIVDEAEIIEAVFPNPGAVVAKLVQRALEQRLGAAVERRLVPPPVGAPGAAWVAHATAVVESHAKVAALGASLSQLDCGALDPTAAAESLFGPLRDAHVATETTGLAALFSESQAASKTAVAAAVAAAAPAAVTGRGAPPAAVHAAAVAASATLETARCHTAALSAATGAVISAGAAAIDRAVAMVPTPPDSAHAVKTIFESTLAHVGALTGVTLSTAAAACDAQIGALRGLATPKPGSGAVTVASAGATGGPAAATVLISAEDRVAAALNAAAAAAAAVAALHRHVVAAVAPHVTPVAAAAAPCTAGTRTLRSAVEGGALGALSSAVALTVSSLERLLAVEQRPADFWRPDVDAVAVDLRPTPAATTCAALLTFVRAAAGATLDGRNRRAFLGEVGCRFCDSLSSHARRFSYTAAGALQLKADVTAHGELVRSFGAPVAAERFARLGGLVNLLLVPPESVTALADASLSLPHREALRWVELREDFRAEGARANPAWEPWFALMPKGTR